MPRLFSRRLAHEEEEESMDGRSEEKMRAPQIISSANSTMLGIWRKLNVYIGG